MISKTEQVLLTLLKGALSGRLSESESCFDLSDNEWTEVKRLAVKHGVSGPAYDGVQLLPSNQQPPEELSIEWSVNVGLLEKRYHKKCGVVRDLKDWLASHQLRMMLLKGFDIASFYPVPAHREWGDFDIWLFGKKEEGDRLAAKELHEEIEDGGHHSSFYYKGVRIENHEHFLYDESDDPVVENHFAEFNRLEKAIEPLAETNEKLTLENGTDLYVPAATFNFLFFAGHMARHFTRNLGLRNFFDWACFLNKNRDKYDKELVRTTFEGTHLSLAVEVFTRLAIRLFDLPANCDPCLDVGQYDKRLENKVLKKILNPFLAERPETKILRPVWRLNSLFKNWWNDELIYRKNVFQQIAFHFHRNSLGQLFS